MTRSPLLRLGVACAVLYATTGSARAESESPSDLAARSLATCEAGRLASARADRLAHFNEGEALARKALAANEKSPQAHFALFCNMGESMRIDGESVQALVGLKSLMKELDRSLELDPNYLDALSSKGTFLVKLPRLMGGDVSQGEAMLRRVADADPNAFNSRIVLAQVLIDRGDKDEATKLATRALDIAKAKNRPDKIAEAQAVLAKLGVQAH